MKELTKDHRPCGCLTCDCQERTVNRGGLCTACVNAKHVKRAAKAPAYLAQVMARVAGKEVTR